MNSRGLILALSILAVITAASCLGRRGGLVGGYSPVENLLDPQVQEVAKYAVTEHNKKAGADLEYEKTVKGDSQVVAGINYILVIAAKDGDNVRNYQAVVYDRPWDSYRDLKSFVPL